MKFLLIIAISFAFSWYMSTLTQWLDELDK
nr:MAG TPA: hypothetical protein [Caudoviricetes sp.]